MELRHLRYFVAVAEEENITRAAARLHVSQPPLSRQIRDLEDEIGVILLERGPRSVRLTPAGTVFASGAREVLRLADGIVAQVRELAGIPGCVLHVGYAPSLTVEILPQALRAFEQAHPHSGVTLHDLSTEEMMHGLIEGTLDVALMIRPSQGVAPQLWCQEICRYAVAVAMPQGHRLARIEQLGLADLHAERILAYGRDGYPEYCQWLERVLGAGQRVVETFDSSTSLLAAVEAGRGVALVPECFRGFAGTRLEIRLLDAELEPFVVVAALRANSKPAAEQFLRLVTHKNA